MKKNNIKLRMACVAKRLKLYEIANRAGIEPTRFSKILRGILEITKDEKRMLSKVLGKPQKDLF